MRHKKTPQEIQAEFEEQERQERLRQLDLIQTCMKVILTGCEPADVGSADNFFTTIQFSNAIADHIGERMPNELIFEYLIGEGYKFARSGNTAELRWMVRNLET